MGELNALLAGIVSDPLEETRWLVLADWLEEYDDPRRGELLRLHRRLLATCCEPEKHPDREEWHSRIVELIAAGVRPCVPQKKLALPGGITLTGSFISPGSFLMGSKHTEATKFDRCVDERPVHTVTLTNGFFVGIQPVTQAQWKVMIGTNPSRFKGPNRPVESVSWDDCQQFCKKLTDGQKGQVTVRLPTEAEWEYACRSGTTTEYHFGDVINSDLINYNGNHSWNKSPKGEYREQTTDVGSARSNAWGLFDVHGNVWEWCEDWYGHYAAKEQTNPCQTRRQFGDLRVLRGGSWNNNPVGCRAAYRDWIAPTDRHSNCGFRVCFRLAEMNAQ